MLQIKKYESYNHSVVEPKKQNNKKNVGKKPQEKVIEVKNKKVSTLKAKSVKRVHKIEQNVKKDATKTKMC